MEDSQFHPSMESISLEDVVKQEYRVYQIYTLMDRAIPYLEDGLKPVQRRILYTLYKNQSKGLTKVSAATGLVLTLHPHGPQSIESSIVNLAQDYAFSNNYPLVDKKGYFGERMETSPAAGRYIECKIGKIAQFLLFDDLNQVQMQPNYDETNEEPIHLLPKLPLMLINGAEGIGTGFSSVIPSFHHKDICDSMISFVETGKAKKIRPYVHFYKAKIEQDKGKYIFPMIIEEKGGDIFITELPRGYDATKTYKYLNKLIEKDIIKDYVDSSVDNDVMIELLFKRGQQPTLEEAQKAVQTVSSLSPNYTLISERGVSLFDRPESIIEIFTGRRLKIVKRRYELLCEEMRRKIGLNNEVIKFIRQKEYETATKSKNRKSFVDHLKKKKFNYFDYLADMPIYRMTKDEVEKRKLLVKEDTANLKGYEKIAKSPTLIKKELIKELQEVKTTLTEIIRDRDSQRQKLRKKVVKKSRAKRS